MMTVDDVIYCVNCRGLEIEWFDCDKHGYTDENAECYKLYCHNCGYDDYDCGDCNCGQEDPLPVAHDDGCPVWEQARQEQEEREISNVQN
jgi:hypothetical protein